MDITGHLEEIEQLRAERDEANKFAKNMVRLNKLEREKAKSYMQLAEIANSAKELYFKLYQEAEEELVGIKNAIRIEVKTIKQKAMVSRQARINASIGIEDILTAIIGEEQ